ncbi:unnamed protein product [Amoebophrya sp. A25]|nr:unnamed protein product [Amoebophrya sp. A25]|eukprot:GSA25T00019226001.1
MTGHTGNGKKIIVARILWLLSFTKGKVVKWKENGNGNCNGVAAASAATAS